MTAGRVGNSRVETYGKHTFDEVVVDHAPEVQRLAWLSRNLVLDSLPVVVEVCWPRQGPFVAVDQRHHDALLVLQPHQRSPQTRLNPGRVVGFRVGYGMSSLDCGSRS